MSTIFLIDDDEAVLSSTKRWLQISKHQVTTFNNGWAALEHLETAQPDVVVCDVKMPQINGMELLPKLLRLQPQLAIIMMTGHGDIAMAVMAMREGAYDFIEKPFEPEHLLALIDRACQKSKLEQENAQLRAQLQFLTGLESKIIGKSTPSKQLRKTVIGIAAFNANVIISGDTGVGKELVARCLHECSTRADGPFVAINCGAIPENLLESELFGHEKGAFTGAEKKRIGKLEFANDGVLFLDEIESMPLSFQVKLLRALQENSIERLGSNQQIHINPRVICATKTNLKELADKGEFRADLFYRLKVAEVVIPSLHQRKADIPLLFEHFLKEAEAQYNLELRRPDDQEILELSRHAWPGNIREIKNTAQRYAIESTINQARINTEFLSSSINSTEDHSGEFISSEKLSLSEQVKQFEKQQISQAIHKHQGKIQKVMEDLNISRRTLNLKMQQYQLKREDFIQPS